MQNWDKYNKDRLAKGLPVGRPGPGLKGSRKESRGMNMIIDITKPLPDKDKLEVMSTKGLRALIESVRRTQLKSRYRSTHKLLDKYDPLGQHRDFVDVATTWLVMAKAVLESRTTP